MNVLIVEDDRVLSNNICEILNHKYNMSQAYDGEEGLERIMKEDFDVIILDVMMPKLDGFEVLEHMRQAGVSTPVLMLTALSQNSDQLRCLKAGADDYISKPFDLDVFQARLEVLVRRTKMGEAAQEKLLEFLDMTIDKSRHVVKIGDNKLDIHGKQFDLLYSLVDNKNTIVPKERLFQRVWGFYSDTDFSVVEVYTSQIRKILRKYDYEKYLKTVRGVGYILTDDSEIYG